VPELPEVHTISSDLNTALKGFVIKDVVITKNYIVRPSNNYFLKNIKDKNIIEVRRIAKNIVVNLEGNLSLIFHLAMTGRILLKSDDAEDRWTKVKFMVEKGSIHKVLKFTDMRMFGKVELVESKKIADLEKKYGPEPLNNNLTPKQLYQILHSKKTNIKNALLDQSLVSGLGNIYATDTLFLARILILQSARKVLTEGIFHRGSTLKDKMYVDIYGNPGSHQEHFYIYMREICSKCQTKVEYIKVNGRGTYFCPSCQTLVE
jgi:formamidopyrimidine-DNA glycosylase